MSFVFNHTTPSPTLLQRWMKKVNALGSQPRVVVELDKYSHVPGIKQKFEVVELIRSSSLRYVASAGYIGSLYEEPEIGNQRLEYIKCASKHAVDTLNLDEHAHYFLLAVCRHETQFGTAGKGVKSKGSFVLGYGCPADCKNEYSGILTQFYYGAKRYKEALRSRLNTIAARGGLTRDDVAYFHDGGDKGTAYKWSADRENWISKVWQYYQEIRSNPSQWNCSGAFTFTASTASLSDPVFPVEGLDFDKGAYVSSHHGSRNSKRPNHKGIDIVSTDGINGKWAVAAYAGVVRKVGYDGGGYGNYVVIRHNNGYETVYAHLQNNSIQVYTGQQVAAGQRLGKVGSTGNSTGPHLHFELWRGPWPNGEHIDPYPVLRREQKISAAPYPSDRSPTGGWKGSAGEDLYPTAEITENIKFNKCFKKDGKLSKDWVKDNRVTWFTVPNKGNFVGFAKGSVKKGEDASFSFKHNFTADGYFEWSYYCDLKHGDVVTVTVDGMVVAQYTEADNGQVHDAAPVHVRFLDLDGSGVNSHVIDFHLESASGQAVFGIACFKCAEVEVSNGFIQIDEDLNPRTSYRWFDTGAFVYETTFIIEDDILQWEVNTHFDMRSATARVTLDNKHGLYSPSYRRDTIFPRNLRKSEMSYYEGGKLRHVLSEGTPVRIYAGYGDELVRVFTGRIKGEIEEDSENKTITFSCVDMYDKLEECVFLKPMGFPDNSKIHGDEKRPITMWVKSAIIHYIVDYAGLKGWRVHEDDLRYPDAIIEETYYIDIDRGGVTAVVFDPKTQKFVEKEIKTVKTINGYKNPFVDAVEFPEGTRASDAIAQLIDGIMYRSYCDRYGTYRLENIRDIYSNDRWEFIDGENLISLTTSVDHSRVRNHIAIAGASGRVDHFIDNDLFIALKGELRSAFVTLDWIDESFGSNARGVKEEVANRLFFDMKRQARTFNVVVKGNPMIDVLDGCYIYDQNTSTAGYYVIKGNRLIGNKEGMLNYLELTWEDIDRG